MKIALYLPSLRGGGAERVMVTLANGFVSSGHQVDLVVAQAEGPYLTDVDSRVTLVDLGAGRVSKSLPPLVRYLRRSRPHSMLSAMSHANVVAVVARLLAGTKTRLVVSEHNTFAGKSLPTTGITGWLVPLSMRATYRLADDIVAVSAGAAAALANVLGVTPARVRVIHNPAVTEELFARAAEPLTHPWITRDDRPFILSVGRLTTQKQHAALLKAFASVRNHLDVRLVILGEGELRSHLEALSEELGIRDHLLMPGFVANPYAWMRRCAAFVLSSAWEGCPMVLIEAMACGARIVSTDCPAGPAEILEDGRWGRLVPMGDIEAMSTAIREAVQDSRPADDGRPHERFTAAHATGAYLDILEGRRAR